LFQFWFTYFNYAVSKKEYFTNVRFKSTLFKPEELKIKEIYSSPADYSIIVVLAFAQPFSKRRAK
jgi:hypothetical protein